MAAASTSTRTTKTAKPAANQRGEAPGRRASDAAKPEVAKNEATEAKATETKKATVARVTGVVKAERFAKLAKELGWETKTSDATPDGAVVTVTRKGENGSEILRAEWRENKLVIGAGLPTWKFVTKEGKEGASLIVHNVGEAKRIMAVDKAEASPEAATKVRYDASLTGTQRRKLAAAEEATAE